MGGGGAGHIAHSFCHIELDQTYLSQIADQAGGENYCRPFSSPASLKPFLEDLTIRLANQYLLTYTLPPEREGDLEPIEVTTDVPGAGLVSADNVYIEPFHKLRSMK